MKLDQKFWKYYYSYTTLQLAILNNNNFLTAKIKLSDLMDDNLFGRWQYLETKKVKTLQVHNIKHANLFTK